MIAYCYRYGKIHTTDESSAPEGSIEVFRGPAKYVRRLIEETTTDGKIAGINEGAYLDEELKILDRYMEDVRTRSNPMIKVPNYLDDMIAASQESV